VYKNEHRFHRQAKSLEDAIRASMADVQNAGATAVKQV